MAAATRWSSTDRTSEDCRATIPGDGLYLTALSYTPSGNKYAREYRDLSPAVLLDDDGEVIFCHSVALCPQGEVRGLSFYSVDVRNLLR